MSVEGVGGEGEFVEFSALSDVWGGKREGAVLWGGWIDLLAQNKPNSIWGGVGRC